MDKIVKTVLLFILIISWSAGVAAQNLVKESNLTREIDIGIVEKLGTTIPLNLTFNNENSESVSLGELIKKPTILMFVYFDCPNLCSPLMDGVAEMLSKLDMTIGKDFEVITISFNTKDTPEKAKEKKVNFVSKISKENQKYWTYLTGTQEHIDSITAAVGYKYKSQGLDFAHPSAIMILSPQGKITRYLYGLTFLPFDVKMAIIEAQKGIARPTSSKVLEYCFAYNPSSKTYTLQVTRIVGILMLFVLAVGVLVLFFRKKSKTKNAV
jgi:protein SCO1